MRRKLIPAVPIAAVSVMSGLLLSPGIATAAPPTNAQLLNWAGGPPAPTSGSFTATSKTFCTSGTWSTAGGMLTLTCTNGTDSITMTQSTGKVKGKTTGIFTITSGTGAFASATGQLNFVQDVGTTGDFSGSIS